MDLPYALELLIAADEQPYGFIKLRGPRADYQVRLLVAAGLVEATLNDGLPGSYTSINRLTDLGETFLRAFPDRSIPHFVPGEWKPLFPAEWQSHSQLGATNKAKGNFANGSRLVKQGAA